MSILDAIATQCKTKKNKPRETKETQAEIKHQKSSVNFKLFCTTTTGRLG